MPAAHQQGHAGEYKSEAHKFIQTKPTRVLTALRFITEEDARHWLGAWNAVGEDAQVRDHFISEIKRLQTNDD